MDTHAQVRPTPSQDALHPAMLDLDGFLRDHSDWSREVARRLTVQRAREISAFSDHFALLLLMAIIVSGDAMRFGAHFDLAQTHLWAKSLLSFSPLVSKSGAFLVHLTLALVLIMDIPFSKILHFGGIVFTQALVHRR